jgi:hypothetical protein
MKKSKLTIAQHSTADIKIKIVIDTMSQLIEGMQPIAQFGDISRAFYKAMRCIDNLQAQIAKDYLIAISNDSQDNRQLTISTNDNAAELKKWLSDSTYLSSNVLPSLFQRTWLQTKTLLVKFHIKPQKVMSKGIGCISFYKKSETMRAVRFLNTNPNRYLTMRQLSILWNIHIYAVKKHLENHGVLLQANNPVEKLLCHQSALALRPTDEQKQELQEWAIIIQKNVRKRINAVKAASELKIQIKNEKKQQITYLDGTRKCDYLTLNQVAESWRKSEHETEKILLSNGVKKTNRVKHGERLYHKSALSLNTNPHIDTREKWKIAESSNIESTISISELSVLWQMPKSLCYRLLIQNRLQHTKKIVTDRGRTLLFYDRESCNNIKAFNLDKK